MEDLLHTSLVDKTKKLQIIMLYPSPSVQWKFDSEDKYPDWILSMKSSFDSIIAKQELRGVTEVGARFL